MLRSIDLIGATVPAPSPQDNPYAVLSRSKALMWEAGVSTEHGRDQGGAIIVSGLNIFLNPFTSSHGGTAGAAVPVSSYTESCAAHVGTVVVHHSHKPYQIMALALSLRTASGESLSALCDWHIAGGGLAPSLAARVRIQRPTACGQAPRASHGMPRLSAAAQFQSVPRDGVDVVERKAAGCLIPRSDDDVGFGAGRGNSFNRLRLNSGSFTQSEGREKERKTTTSSCCKTSRLSTI